MASTLWWVEARDKNFLLRQQLDQGINPALERKKEKERIKETVQEEKRIAKGEAHPLSLEAVALDWLEDVRKTWKPRTYKAVRHDAVRMCGLIVSSDREFFSRLGPEETGRFFEESKAFLTDFVGTGNVISAMVHMDEKTPHMHFLHVPVINGRLNLQADADALEKDVLLLAGKVDALREQESALQERLQLYETQAKEAEKILQEEADIPEASVFSFKAALEKARQIIELQKQALAIKQAHADKARRLEDDVTGLQAKLKKQQTETQQTAEKIKTMQGHIDNLQAQLDEILPFMYQHHITYEYNKFFEHQKVAQKQQEEKARQEALQRQQAEERERASQSRQASAYRGMRMGRCGCAESSQEAEV